jgi:hypothetical protein
MVDGFLVSMAGTRVVILGFDSSDVIFFRRSSRKKFRSTNVRRPTGGIPESIDQSLWSSSKMDKLKKERRRL